jgi:hypothetical protein
MERETPLAPTPWSEMKEFIRLEWPELSDDEIEAIDGWREGLCALLQQSYHCSAQEAEDKARDFETRYGAFRP